MAIDARYWPMKNDENAHPFAHPYYWAGFLAVSYTHLRAHETVLDLVCRLLLEKKKYKNN